MTVQCMGAMCGAFYTQGYPGPLLAGSLIAAGWQHTDAGWLCDDCALTQPDLGLDEEED